MGVLTVKLRSSLLSMALYAHSTSKEVYISGLGACDNVTNSECLYVISIES